MPEWPIGIDCKSIGLALRRFESSPLDTSTSSVLAPSKIEVQAILTMYKNGFWYVYLLLCDQKTFYVGIAPKVSNRLQDHIDKEPLYTRRFSEIKFVYCEKYASKYKAALREKQLKGWSRAKKQMLIDRKINDPHCIELDEVLGEKDEEHVRLH